MENLRLLLLVSLAFVGLMLWQAWLEDYGPKPETVTTAQTEETLNQAETAMMDDVPEAAQSALDDKPPIVPTEAKGSKTSQRIIVETDVYKAEIDTYGGDLREIDLKAYPVSSDRPDIPLILMSDQDGAFYAAQGGVLSKQTGVNHHTIYQADEAEYRLLESDQSIDVNLHWQGDDLSVEKIYTFQRDSYLINVSYRLKNTGTTEWQGRIYNQLHRKHTEEGRKMLPTFTGAAVSTPEKRYEKVAFDDMQENPVSIDTDEGWVAMLQHYFVSALIPPVGQKHHYYSKVVNSDHYIIGLYGSAVSLQPGEEVTVSTELYSGPKSQKKLEKIAPGLDLTVDYGVLWFIAKPLYWLLDKFHAITGNWGWAIIFVTVVIKLAFFPLSAMGFRSMAKMRKMQPRMVALKERYGSDKARLNQAMMELYKTEKINPLGGCFPILIQIPVFLALYWVLLETVDLRQAPFMLWIKDLSIADPYFVLPLVMGASMFLQQKLNPAPLDPMQAKIMQFLPIIFTVFFAFFPAGLVLYWVVNNILSIAQQWAITLQIESES
jgi:YidC/Oxa1 family membrane protein insertase